MFGCAWTVDIDDAGCLYIGVGGEQVDKLWSVTVDIMLLSKHIQAWDANARLTGYKMKNQGLLSSWIMQMWLFQSETLDLFLSTKSFQEP